MAVRGRHRVGFAWVWARVQLRRSHDSAHGEGTRGRAYLQIVSLR